MAQQEPDNHNPTRAAARRWALEGVRQALTGPAYFVAVALVGVGGLAKAAGFPAGAAFLSTLLIWAGPAQVLFFGAIAAKTALPAVALTVCLSSVRFVPMCLSVLPMLRRPGVRMSTMVAASHYIAVTVWAESLRRLPDVPRAARLPFFFGFANACVLMTGVFTLVGYYLIGALPPAFAAGVLFLTPVYFLSTIVRGARAAIDWFAIGFGLVLAPITQAYVGGGFDLLVLGVVGGAGAFFSARAWDFWRRSAA